MISYEKNERAKTLLFNSDQIETYIVSLLHEEITIGYKIFFLILNILTK